MARHCCRAPSQRLRLRRLLCFWQAQPRLGEDKRSEASILLSRQYLAQWQRHLFAARTTWVRIPTGAVPFFLSFFLYSLTFFLFLYSLNVIFDPLSFTHTPPSLFF